MPVSIENDHRMLAPIEGVDPVLGVGGDASDLDEAPSFRQLLPAFEHLVFDTRHAPLERPPL